MYHQRRRSVLVATSMLSYRRFPSFRRSPIATLLFTSPPPFLRAVRKPHQLRSASKVDVTLLADRFSLCFFPILLPTTPTTSVDEAPYILCALLRACRTLGLPAAPSSARFASSARPPPSPPRVEKANTRSQHLLRPQPSALTYSYVHSTVSEAVKASQATLPPSGSPLRGLPFFIGSVTRTSPFNV